jgi:hypothetical protein
MPKDQPNISLLAAPYPYRSMLAICSDLDETESSDVYFNTMEYLNTSGQTQFGKGVGLETGNSLYFYMPGDQFAYWNTDDASRERARTLIHSGHIDCFHSFGDLANQRHEVESTLDHLQSYGCRMRSWIDHAVAPSNFGGDIMQGFGDVKLSDIYHADITLAFGVEYVWIGRVTSMHGQDAAVSLSGIWSASCPAKSADTLCKELVKVAVGKLGNQKYSFHADNRLTREIRLRDGQRVTEFMRSNPHPQGVSVGDTSEGLGAALSDTFLDNLVQRQAKTIVYTHLGKRIDKKQGFAEGTRIALEKLSDRQRQGQVLATTTTRLLDFTTMLKSANWSARQDGDACEIAVNFEGAAPPVAGLSFEVDANCRHTLLVNGQPVSTNRHEHISGERDVVSVPWKRLDFPIG